jgi:hypothetical protein
VPLWWGSVFRAPAPAACLGLVRERPCTLPSPWPDSDTPPSTEKQDHWLSGSPTRLASCTKHPADSGVTRSQPDRRSPPTPRRVPSQPQCQPGETGCPSLPGKGPRGFGAVKATPLRGGLRPALTAPTPRGIGSYARNREKRGQPSVLPGLVTLRDCGVTRRQSVLQGFLLQITGFILRGAIYQTAGGNYGTARRPDR